MIPKVTRFTIDETAAEKSAFHAAIRGGRGYVPPGTYTRLTHRGCLVMSDTPDEMRDHLPIVRAACGHVLINGLGLGMVLGAVLAKPEVEAVAVVEIDPDVVELVAPHYASPRVTIHQADALTWRPPAGVRFGAVWHDIWPDICVDNLADMTRLKRRYAKRTDWQGCWSEHQTRREIRR